jgi:hypothetical protein
MNMIELTWPDGSVTLATTWDGIDEIVRKVQWNRPDFKEFRETMASRARRWSNDDIDPSLPAEEFYSRLAEIGMCRLGTFTEGIPPKEAEAVK